MEHSAPGLFFAEVRFGGIGIGRHVSDRNEGEFYGGWVDKKFIPPLQGLESMTIWD